MKSRNLVVAWILLICGGLSAAQDKLPAPQPSDRAQQSNPDDPPMYKPRPDMTPPRPLENPQPSYSDKARKAKYQGTCLLSLVVGTDGLTHDIRVERPLGMGLEEKAVEAVSQWKFEPAKKEGQPVAVRIQVEVSFHLR